MMAQENDNDGVFISYKRYLCALKATWPTNDQPQVVTNNEIEGADVTYYSGYLLKTNHVIEVSHKPIHIDYLLDKVNVTAMYESSNLLEVVGNTRGELWCANFTREGFVGYINDSPIPCNFETTLNATAKECILGELQVTEILRLGLLYATPQSVEFDLDNLSWTATDRFCKKIVGQISITNGVITLEYSVLNNQKYKVKVFAGQSQNTDNLRGKFSNEDLFIKLLPEYIKVYNGDSSRPFCIYEKQESYPLKMNMTNLLRFNTNLKGQMEINALAISNTTLYFDQSGQRLQVRTDTKDYVDPNAVKRRTLTIRGILSIIIITGVMLTFFVIKREKT